jgi:hypothetical protein
MATSTLEDLAIDASASLLNQDRQEVRTAYERDEADGSIMIALMVIAIMVNVARLVMDHCVDEKNFAARARKPRHLDRMNAHRRVRQMYRQMKIKPEVMEGLEAEQIADEMLSRGMCLDEDVLVAVWNEGHEA